MEKYQGFQKFFFWASRWLVGWMMIMGEAPMVNLQVWMQLVKK